MTLEEIKLAKDSLNSVTIQDTGVLVVALKEDKQVTYFGGGENFNELIYRVSCIIDRIRKETKK